MPVSLLDGYSTTPPSKACMTRNWSDAWCVALVATWSGVPSNYDVVKQGWTTENPTPGSVGKRARQRRRSGNLDPGARCTVASGERNRATRARRLRHGYRISSYGRSRARRADGADRPDRPRRRDRHPRLAACADRSIPGRRDGSRVHAGLLADLRRRCPKCHLRTRPRPARARVAQAGGERLAPRRRCLLAPWSTRAC